MVEVIKHFTLVIMAWLYVLQSRIRRPYQLICNYNPRQSVFRLRSLPEEPKIAIHFNRYTALLRCVVHVIPMLGTFGILQLSFRTVYWKDVQVSSSNQNSILNTLQLVAKLHEISIIGSLSEMLLHSICYDLSTGHGVPLGLLTSAYQISSITFLWSWQFWGGIVKRDLRQGYSRRLTLFILVILASFMAVFVGPASAVAIIPQLDWWKVPFGWADEGTVFIPISIEDLWPNNLTSANVPEPECYSSLAFQYRHCPSAGLAAISRWDPQNWRVNPNITISISNSSMVRHLVSVASRLSSGYTQSSTLSDLFARDLSCAFDIGAHSGILGLTHVNRPLVEEIMPEGKSLRKPFVEVECAAYNVYSQEAIQFPHGRLRGHSLMDNFEDQWSVPEEAWNSSASLRDPIKLSWVDLASRSQAASIGLVFVANIQVQTFPETIFQRQIIPCTVSARWIPVKMWIDPTNDNSIHENLIDVVKSAAFQQQSAAVVGTRQISIHESWANALNIQPEGFNYTALELMVASSPFGKDVLPEYLNTVSHFVGMYIAEGLARLKSGLPSYYHSSYLIRGHNGTTIDTLELPTGICPSLCNGPWGAWRPPIYMNKLGWTQIDFIARRYGYGWGLKGIPVQLAAIVLILDACLCVIHITRILSTGWTSSMLSTEGELTALALNSAPTEKLKNTCAGIERIGTWKKMIKIREVGNQHLELVVKDDNNEEEVGVPPIPNKKYGVMPGGYRKVSKRKVKSNSK